MSRTSVASVLFVLCISLAFAEPQSAERQSGTITGTITDPTGAVIAGARVLVHWDSWGGGGWKNIGIKDDQTVVADGAGKYSMVVPPGFYDVFVSAPAFTPVAAKVWVKQGQQTVFGAKLRIDPDEIRELGTRH